MREVRRSVHSRVKLTNFATSLIVSISELHMFRGLESDGVGQIMGHEFTGRVVEVGKSVKTIERGDNVVASFTTAWYAHLPW